MLSKTFLILFPFGPIIFWESLNYKGYCNKIIYLQLNFSFFYKFPKAVVIELNLAQKYCSAKTSYYGLHHLTDNLNKSVFISN